MENDRNEVISARVTSISKDRLQRIAARLKRSMSQVLDLALSGELDLQAEIERDEREQAEK